MEIKSLVHVGFDELYEAFQQAFAGYEVQLNKNEHLTMFKRRGYKLELSFAAFDGDKIVSFTCNGTGQYNGTPTAYDTGTGTLPAYRGKGLATQIFTHSIPYLKDAGIKKYLLEVLQHNAQAVSVYRKIGFSVTREFLYFKAETDQVVNHTKPIAFPCKLQTIDINHHPEISAFHDFTPAWQNSIESINRSPQDFICTGAFAKDKLVGYSVFEPQSGDIAQLATDKPYRRKGIASLLLQTMLESTKCTAIKLVNTDITCNSITAFLQSKNIQPAGKQFEMIKRLGVQI